MADGQLFKPEKDYTKEADKQIPDAYELAKVRDAVGLSESIWLTNCPTGQCPSSTGEAFCA